jgi:hypothetical protein
LINYIFEKYFLFDLASKAQITQNECELFNPVLTSSGICHSFNAPKFENILQSGSRFYKSFESAYRPDFVGQDLPPQKAYGNGMQLVMKSIITH